MSLSLTDLQTARDALQKAIFSGVRTVRYSDRSVEYASVSDMNAALAQIDAQISATSTTGVGNRCTYSQADRG